MAAGKVDVELSIDAQLIIEQINQRWLDGHRCGSNPLIDQVYAALDRLSDLPQLGEQIGGEPPVEYRKLLLRAGWFLYYDYDPTRRHLLCTAIWYAGRGSSPER